MLAAEPLAEKYKTVEEFTKAVQTKGHKAMNFFKNSIPLIKEVAKELGIKEAKGGEVGKMLANCQRLNCAVSFRHPHE